MQTFLSFLAAIGGVGTLIVVTASFLSKWASDSFLEHQKASLGRETDRLKAELSRDAEAHKFTLRKREILFGLEIEAATAFFGLRRRFEPKYTHSDKDHDEATEDVLSDLSAIAIALDEYLTQHGIALDETERVLLSKCRTDAEENQFALRERNNLAEYDKASDAAWKILSDLQKVEKTMASRLRS